MEEERAVETAGKKEYMGIDLLRWVDTEAGGFLVFL